MKLGFVSAGRMGLPMVGRLAAAGHQVRAVARTPERRAALTEAATPAVGHATAEVAFSRAG